MKQFAMLIFTLALFIGCKVESVEIKYGGHMCNYCQMTVVDPSHAAQYVTEKGKAYIFDSIECMYFELKEKDISEPELILVSNYENPGQLINARTSWFIIDKDIPSPMGKFLSALPTEESISRFRDEDTQVYKWSELKLENEVNSR